MMMIQEFLKSLFFFFFFWVPASKNRKQVSRNGEGCLSPLFCIPRQGDGTHLVQASKRVEREPSLPPNKENNRFWGEEGGSPSSFPIDPQTRRWKTSYLGIYWEKESSLPPPPIITRNEHENRTRVGAHPFPSIDPQTRRWKTSCLGISTGKKRVGPPPTRMNFMDQTKRPLDPLQEQISRLNLQ